MPETTIHVRFVAKRSRVLITDPEIMPAWSTAPGGVPRVGETVMVPTVLDQMVPHDVVGVVWVTATHVVIVCD